MAVGEVTPGHEIWHPNREKSVVLTTRFAIIALMIATAALAALIAIAGFTLLIGGAFMGVVCLIYALLYVLFAFLVSRWSRGTLPVAASLSMILAIFCAIGAGSWFARDKSGFEEALLPVPVIGLLVIVLGLMQIVLLSLALYGFNQDWHVEVERPIGSGEDYGAGAPGNGTAAQPA